MASKFPGMNPYLEGYLWSDVHSSLIAMMRRVIVPQLPEKYVARIEIQHLTDRHIEQEMGIMYPDISVAKKNELREPEVAYETKNPFTPATFTIPKIAPMKWRIPSLYILDKGSNQLVTVIEILSPANKRSPYWEQYLEKQQNLVKTGVHLLEIDLLRRGKRVVQHAKVAAADYLISLTRANKKQTEIWALKVLDKLPVLPVPLHPPDADLKLNVQACFSQICVEGDYERSLDYSEVAPPPVLGEEVLDWMEENVRN